VTAQGHSTSIFKRAIENGNVLVAEMTAREVGRHTASADAQVPRAVGEDTAPSPGPLTTLPGEAAAA
jgi:hypothetical protein